MPFDNWRKRLEIAQQHSTVAARRAAVAALKINFSQPGEDDCGYYRKPITEKDPSGNGLNIIKGWIPVSYFMHGDKLVGIIGACDEARDMTDQEVGDEQLWSYVVSHPISYETYQDVVEHGGEWPDFKNETDNRSAASNADKSPSRAVVAGDALPSEQGQARTAATISNDDNNPPELLPHIEHGSAIDNAIGAAKDLKVTTEEEAALALGAKNRIAELRLAADKAGKAVYQPPFNEYKRFYGLWNPMIGRAEAAEKKLNTAVLSFRESERRRMAKIEADRLEAQRQQDEANARAADRAIAAGEPEPPPVVEELPPAPPLAPVVPTYGTRKLKEEMKTILDAVTDYDAVYAFLKNEPKVRALLLELATAKVKAGFTVPGVVTREGLI